MNDKAEARIAIIISILFILGLFGLIYHKAQKNREACMKDPVCYADYVAWKESKEKELNDKIAAHRSHDAQIIKEHMRAEE